MFTSEINLDPTRRQVRWFGLLLTAFGGALGGVALWKGGARVGMAAFLGVAWLVAMVPGGGDRRGRLWGALLPGMLLAIGGPVRAGVEPATMAAVVWIVGVVTGVAAAGWPALGRRIYVGWMLAALPVGWTVSHAVLAIVYYGVVTPIGLVMRLCGRDPMARRFDRGAASYWAEHRSVSNAARYFRQF